MSEPDYNLDLDRERISSLEALQEDTFYSTGAFFTMMGDLESGRPINYTGRIIPIGRVGEPEDVARCALFLASDDASFITGAHIVVDGGALAAAP